MMEGHLFILLPVSSMDLCQTVTWSEGMYLIHANVCVLISNSASWNGTRCTYTYIHVCLVVANKENTVRWLIRSDLSGTLIHQQDISGNTPAHDAAEYG